MPKSKASAFLSVLLVFVSGAAMGAVGYRLYAVNFVVSPASPQKKNPEEYRKALEKDLREKVKLDDAQFAEVQKVYQDQHTAFMDLSARYHAKVDPFMDPITAAADAETHQIHQTAVSRIRALLRPDQIPLYDKWTADRDAAEKARKGRGKGPDGKQHGPGPRPPLP
jgi:hypothetical protein